MAHVIFFEKTGCVNNTRQKKLLDLAGHEVKAINLLFHPWTRAELLSFFGGLDVAQWFNPNAPAVSSGALDPASFDRESALEALLAEPILIRRPLMIIGDRRLVGFDKTLLNDLIGLEDDDESKKLLSLDLSVCAQKSRGQSCD